MNVNKLKRRFIQLKNALQYFLVFWVLKIYKNSNSYWLIAERGTDARDNGYVFYKYLKENHPEILIKYVITDDSPDRYRIDDHDIIKYGTFKHYYYYITSPILISTHYQGYSPNFQLFSQLDKRGLIKVYGKKVLLDHCVRMGKAGCTKETVKIDMMVCSINKEYNALIENSGYSANILCNIGMPRFDNLYYAVGKHTKKQILFMPTWRIKYTNTSNKNFIRSEYFKACNEILHSHKLNDFLQKNDMTFVFYPHIEMQKFISLFTTSFDRILIKEAGSAIVENLLIESQILITDYSSVFFDFAYMLKPVIYYHFDNDENEKAKSIRWFDFERDGFGPINYTLDDVLECLQHIDLYRLDDLYISRVDDTFGVRNDDNSERVYAAICQL